MTMKRSLIVGGRQGLMGLAAACLGVTALASPAFAKPFKIQRADWDAAKSKLIVAGTGTADAQVAVVNAFDLSQIVGNDNVAAGNERWRVAVKKPSPVPCRVNAQQFGGATAEMDVAGAPADCAPQPPAPPANQPPPANAGGSYTGVAGVELTFDGSGSSDPTVASPPMSGASVTGPRARALSRPIPTARPAATR
jgi:hypothetical protein